MRVTRRHRAGVLLLWMTAPLPFTTLLTWNSVRMLNAGVAGGWRGYPPDWVGWGGHAHPFIQSFQFALLLHFLTSSIVAPWCVLFGGLWGGGRDRQIASA